MLRRERRRVLLFSDPQGRAGCTGPEGRVWKSLWRAGRLLGRHFGYINTLFHVIDRPSVARAV